MIGSEATIVRMDGDNRPVSVHVETGVVDRPNSYYATPLKCEAARRLFLDLIGIVRGVETLVFIKACNRAAARKQLATDGARRDAVLQYAGIAPEPVRSARPHERLCGCPACLARHIDAGCRIVGCEVCFG